MNYLDGIPAEVAELIRPYLDPEPGTLAAISVALTTKRNAAMAARTSSGIENIWAECEDAYIGIDDANRTEFGGSGKWSKPQAMNGPVQAGSTIKGKPDHKSTVFLRLTARYVDAGSAKLSEILLPLSGDKAFSIKETPLPELAKAKKDNSQVVNDEGVPLTRPAQPGEMPPAPAPTTGAAATAVSLTPAPQPAPTAAPGGGAVQPPGAAGESPAAINPPAPRMPLTVGDLAKENIQIAHDKAKLAETRIWDWMVESKYSTNMRKVIADSARLGSGVLKGPHPKVSEAIMTNASKEGGNDVTVQIKREIKPGVSYVDVWNLFPDPSCGDDIHNGEYLFERDYMTDTQVRALKKLPGYITSQIDLVLEQEISPSVGAAAQRNTRYGDEDERKGRRVIWYYYGVLSRDEIDCCRQMSGRQPLTRDDLPADKKHVHVIATMIGDTVVRAVLNPLDTGHFPYRVLPWQRRAGYWAGVGVAEQVRAPQRILNASVRAMLNNAGKSSGSQIVIDQGAIRPANGNWGLEPDKIWYKTADSPGDDVRKAFYAFDVPNMTDEMLKIIEFAEKQAENVSSIPLVTQGQSGKTTPDTFGGMQLQDSNANQLLRSIGANADDCVNEPLVTDFYEWLLLDPKVPNEEKGDFKIDAHGSSALVEQAIENQTLATLVPVSKDPAYGLSPRRTMENYLKSRRMDPKKLQYTEEEQQKIDSTPPPPDPRVQAAQILAASREKIATGSAGIDQQMNAEEIQLRREEMQQELAIKQLEYANKNGLTLTQVKAELAKTAMTLQAQRELAAAAHGVDLHKHHNKGADETGEEAPAPLPGATVKPIAQLPGRAANGQAMSQQSNEDMANAEDETVTS